MLLLALGLPAFIIYNIFLYNPAPSFKATPGFEKYQSQILNFQSRDYEVIGVIDEGGQVRVNVALANPTEDPLETRIQATNALYDMQSLLGRELSVSVWTYRSREARPSDLQGMAFFRALTEQQGYKSAEELR